MSYGEAVYKEYFDESFTGEIPWEVFANNFIGLTAATLTDGGRQIETDKLLVTTLPGMGPLGKNSGKIYIPEVDKTYLAYLESLVIHRVDQTTYQLLARRSIKYKPFQISITKKRP